MTLGELAIDTPLDVITEWFDTFTVGDHQDFEEYLQRVPIRRVQRCDKLDGEDRKIAMEAAVRMSVDIFLGSLLAIELAKSSECQAYYIWLHLRRKARCTYEQLRNLERPIFDRIFIAFADWQQMKVAELAARLGNGRTPQRSGSDPSEPTGAGSTEASPKPTATA